MKATATKRVAKGKLERGSSFGYPIYSLIRCRTLHAIMTEDKPEGKAEPVPWTATDWGKVLEIALPYVDRFLTMKESGQRHDIQQSEAQSRWQIRTTGLLLLFTAFIVGMMAWLTLVGLVGGEALLFVAGIAVGAIFGMLQSQLAPATVVVETPQ